MPLHPAFESLGLAPALTRAVAELGYAHPTPIQAKAIPAVLAGHDILAAAQTGTGKTAAFTLPLLHRLAHDADARTAPTRHRVRVLVLTPTRELAAQIHECVQVYGRYLALRCAVVYGGVGMAAQVEVMRRGVDILVATPGRLLDHAAQKTINLSRLEILVLDEADRMLDMGFIRDIRRILALLPERRQNLLFSATFSHEIRRLAEGLLRDPVTIEVARRNAEAELVSQRIHQVAQDRKRHALAHLVRAGSWEQVLVFTRTKHGANRLAEQLGRDGISATAIHGNKSQPQRLKALSEFKQGAVRVLVATDIAARGLDIEALPHVVNYDLPHVAEDYVHRIGRTGRAGSSGEAISLVSPEERSELAGIERLLGRRIERQPIPGWEPMHADVKPVSAHAPAGPAQKTVKANAHRSERRSARQAVRSQAEHSGPPGAAVTRESRRPNPPRPHATAGKSHRRPIGTLLGALPRTRDERT
ncbi:MAG: DEAD/DEAH box helicase [Burkholderiales bacterium]|nr:DEAD/DEAH box helicase [Burkholderiales bacterium]